MTPYSSDFGKNYGRQKSLKEVHSRNDFILKPLIADLKKKFSLKDKISIADWGGGNGILANDLLSSLSQYKKIEITIIDLDNSKFVRQRGVRNIRSDISEYKSKEKFDYSIAVQVLHYNPFRIQQKIIKNISLNTKEGFLLENFFVRKDREKEWARLNRGVEKILGIYRSTPNLQKTRKELKKHWSSISISKFLISKLNVRDFYIDRFKIKKKYHGLADKYFSKKKLPEDAIVWCRK